MRTYYRVVLIATSLTLAIGACGSKPTVDTLVTPGVETSTASTSTVVARDVLQPGEKRLTTSQASTFSRLLVRNHDAAGAHFVAVVPYGSAATFTLSGDIDWTTWKATATLTTKRSDGVEQPPQQLNWANGQLIQPIEGLVAALEKAGRLPASRITRRLDPKTAALDRVIILINSMSNTRPENPILLRQRTDVAFAGAADLNGASYDRYRYGSSTYWVGSDGSIGKLVSNFRDFAAPVEIVFTDKGPKTIPDAPTDVVDASTVGDILQQLRASQPGT